MPSASFSSPIYDPEELVPAAYDLIDFTFEDLKVATTNFCLDDGLGEGSSGFVYSGKMQNLNSPDDFVEVAVKYMNKENNQRDEQWQAEVNTLRQVSHPNIIKLIGYCKEDDYHLLVYEYMSNRSLDQHLHNGPNIQQTLPWATRYKIALEIATGLYYLHRRKPPVIFGDVKSANILLDENYNAKLSDFGNAMEIPTDVFVHASTRVCGTLGYIAPGIGKNVTLKSDVYSFGVLLLELLTGRKALDRTRPQMQQLLVDWATPYLKHEVRKRLFDIVDPMLKGQYRKIWVRTFAMLASDCIMEEDERPEMGTVVQILKDLQLIMESYQSEPAAHRSSESP